ncbi:MAG: galactokinase [Chloroflexi bacterium]|nr:galactokinase [Chloroflexota bacterium]
MAFYCYILECADGTFYTGWTTDPQRRLRQHNLGRGARYTRDRRPVHLVYVEPQPDRSTAMRRELAIKAMPRRRKQRLAASDPPQILVTATAPGRVNLLGEHVDYNAGPVLPAAIDRIVSLVARLLPGRLVRLEARDLRQSVEFDLDRLPEKRDLKGKPLPDWALYPAGVAWALQEHGLPVTGIEATYASNIPIGAGLSSSAAVEMAFAAVWQAIGGWQIDPLVLAQLALQAENEYVGLACGLMDQFACTFGLKDHVLYFDTRSLAWEAIPLPQHSALVIADTGIRRSLSASAYNQRRAECEQALALLRRKLPGVRALRDVSLHDFEAHGNDLPEIIGRRARHVVSECERVEQAVQCLKAGDAPGLGRLMLAGHASLRDLYEVSTPELDGLVDLAAGIDGCWGARLTGAGFGGCTINLVDAGQVDRFMQALAEGYHKKFGHEASIYHCRASQGVRTEQILLGI